MLVAELPITEYLRAIQIQADILEKKLRSGAPDILLLLEHPPTITLGKRGNQSDLRIPAERLAAMGVAVHSTDRGGEATYHGPGQVVCYPIMDLKPHRMRIRDFVAGLEETIIRTLDHFGVKGFRQAKKVGVWTGPREKIASIGVRIRRGVTSHGLSLNVNMSGDPADLIIVCGMPDARMVNLSQFLDHPLDVKDVKQVLADSFGTVFGVDLQRSSLQEANLM